MSDRLIPLIFISILLLVIDFYIYRAVVSIKKKWGPAKHQAFTYAWWGFSVLLIIGVFISIFFNLQLTPRAIILVAFFLTIVTKIFLLPFVLIDDLRRAIIWLKRKAFSKKKADTIPEKRSEDEKISRSQFIIKAGIAVAAVPLASLTWGIVSSAYDYQIKRRKLYLPNLPKEFDGIKLGQISDIHSGSFYNKKAVLGGVEMLLAEKPDVIFFTGDIVNNLANEMRDYQDLFAKVKAPLGVFSTLGNHDYGDYYFGRGPSAAKAKNLQDVIKTHKHLNWDLLMNENRRLKVDGADIAILGIENWGTGRFPKYGRMDLAVKGTEEAPVKLLLSHDPSHWRAEVLPKYPQIDAMFSGHTHGMQFGVITEHYQWSPVQYIYKEWAGFYREMNQQLYVNVGYGFLGYPGRVGVLPEITIFELTRGSIQA
ncbi:metallophosphoesterase [Pedobacter sp. HMF7647]|uniref:Metallophosphoesterase n=1 Tax=Hufsiella arboris TaxID=2695275 RepID=A0A7K1Y5J5_9SPHI|nr:metallophosphoesterase [Hufsiella arboris]MXV49379.1 metallophosphoesterase [Hufsiella arboris]